MSFLNFALIPLLAVSQNWDFYSREDGLIGNSIWQVSEDKAGYLWIRTAFEGVSRYDGNEFENYNTLKGLISNNINYVFSASDGAIWFCTDRGVSKLHNSQFSNYTSKDGLVSNYINFVFEDKNKELWFASDSGISRFNGNKIEKIKIPGADSKINVVTIYEDRQGILWFGTQNGVLSFHESSFQSPLNFDKSSSVHQILEDSQGTFWFATEDGLFRRSKDNIKVDKLLSGSLVNMIMEDANGQLFFGTQNNGVWKFRIQNQSLNQLDMIAENSILSMLEDCHGNIWIGMDRGICKYHQDSLEIYSEIIGKKPNFVNSIWEEGDENIWFGTSKGLFKHTPNKLIHFSERNVLINNEVKFIVEDPNSTLLFGSVTDLMSYDGGNLERIATLDKNIYSMLIDSKGNKWIGTSQGVLKNFQELTQLPFLQNKSVREILEDKIGNLWFATSDGVVLFDGADYSHFSISNGKHIFIDFSNNLWLGSWDNGLYKINLEGEVINFNMGTGLSSNQVDWLLQTQDENIWFGMKRGISSNSSDNAGRGGIGMYDGQHFKIFSSEDGLPSEFIRYAAEDYEGNLWCASDNGVFRLTLKDSLKIKSFDFDDGLISNYITTIHSDNKGNLWFGSDKGISKYDGENFQNISLNKYLKIGYISNIFEDSKGRIWCLTPDEGMFLYLPPIKQVGPRISIIQMEADNIYMNDLERISIPSGERITFEFKGISFKPKSDRIRYTCLLESEDHKWITSTLKTAIDYQDFEEGDYNFQVRGIDEDLIYSHTPATFNFSVYNPFYQSKIFYSFSSVFLLGLIIGVTYIFNQMRKHRKLAAEYQEKLRLQKEAENIQSAKMTSLRQLIAGVAHEMNNPLGALSGINDVSGRAIVKIESMIQKTQLTDMSIKNQFLKFLDVLKNSCETSQIAAQRLSKIVADLRRFVRLDEAEWQHVNINECIDSALVLLEPEISVNVQIKKNYSNIPLTYCSPSSLNQVFLTIMKNALEAISDKGEIEIFTTEKDNTIKIDIKDNGGGIPPENLPKIFDPGFTTKGVQVGVGLGLSICYKIVVTDHRGHIDVDSHLGRFTTFTISIPKDLGEIGKKES